MIDKNAKEPEIKKARMIIRKLTPEEKKRNDEWLEEERLHDEASYRKMLINEGRAEGRAEEREDARAKFTKAMLENGVSPEMIAKIFESAYGNEARQ